MKTGVISRAANQIFKHMIKAQQETGAEFDLSCNYYEIYNEKLYDLLSDKSVDE
jgi:hypothetical protein